MLDKPQGKEIPGRQRQILWHKVLRMQEMTLGNRWHKGAEEGHGQGGGWEGG